MAVQMRCPEHSSLRALFDGTLPTDEQTALQHHLDECPLCQRTLEDLAAGQQSWCDAARYLARLRTPADDALHRVVATFEAEARTATQSEGDTNDDLALDFLSPPDDPAHLGKLRQYQVLEVLGRGGMGVVLKAIDPDLNRVVAIKVMAPQLATNAGARRRFRREGQAAAAITHDNVVAVYAVDEINGLPFLVKQFIPGLSLQQRLDQGGPLAVPEILHIGRQIAAGLAAAHARGLVHRDIKPGNILIEETSEVERLPKFVQIKVTDFGLARAVDDVSVTQSGVIAGTPLYMSPEQAQGLAVDHRSDLFSLGSVLYAMCTGQPPFRASGNMAVLKRVSEDAPELIGSLNPAIPYWLCVIIAKLHAKDPAERFQSAQEVADLLGQHLAHLQQPAEVPLPAPVEAPASRGAGVPPASQPAGEPPVPRRSRPRLVTFLFCLECFGLGLGVLGLVIAYYEFVRYLVSPKWAEPLRLFDHFFLSMVPVALAHVAGQQRRRMLAQPSRRIHRFENALVVAVGLFAIAYFFIPPVHDFAQTVIRIASHKGVLEIEADDEDLEITIKNAQMGTDPIVEVVNKRTKRRFELAATDWGFLVVKEKPDGVRTKTTKFELSRGGKVSFHASILLEDAVAAAQARLQGTWIVVAGEENGQKVDKADLQGKRLIFHGRKYTMYHANDRGVRGTFKVDPAAKPKRIDFIPDAAPDEPNYGIYQLEGDTLKLCVAEVERPTKFATRPSERIFMSLYELRRAPADLLPDEKKQTEFDALEGEWLPVSAEQGDKPLSKEKHQEITLSLKGNRCRLTLPEGDRSEGTYAIAGGQFWDDLSDSRAKPWAKYLLDGDKLDVVFYRHKDFNSLKTGPLLVSFRRAAFQPLFNGKDLDGWRVFLDPKAKGADPKNHWQVKNDILWCSGQVRGYLISLKDYDNYVLSLKWRYGIDLDRSSKASGVYVHVTGPDKIWPKGCMVTLRSGKVGDLYLVNGFKMAFDPKRVDPNLERHCLRLPGADDIENPFGEWNTCVITCQADKVRVEINGRLVNEAERAEITRGRIMLKSEFAAIHFKDIMIKQLSPAPPTIVPPPPPLNPKDLAELDKFKGSWAVIIGEVGGKPLAAKDLDKLEIHFGAGEFEILRPGRGAERLLGTFKIDAAKKQIILQFKDVKAGIPCSYYFEGDRLRLDFEGLQGLAGAPGDLGAAIHAAGQRTGSIHNLKQLALGMHGYSELHGSLPPAALSNVQAKDGKPLLSWRVAILPFIGAEALYQSFKLDEPWDSPHNKKLIARMPAVYVAPGVKTSEPGRTYYQVFVGPGTAFEARKNSDPRQGIGLLEMVDGTTRTLLVVEAAEPVIWTKPEDLLFAPKQALPKLGTYRAGIGAAFCDGSVAVLPPDLAEATLRALITRNGAEPIPDPLPGSPQSLRLRLECERLRP